MARDVVCGMHVESPESGLQVRLEGHVYSFCSEACLAEFRRHPEDYTGAPDDGDGGTNV